MVESGGRANVLRRGSFRRLPPADSPASEPPIPSGDRSAQAGPTGRSRAAGSPPSPSPRRGPPAIALLAPSGEDRAKTFHPSKRWRPAGPARAEQRRRPRGRRAARPGVARRDSRRASGRRPTGLAARDKVAPAARAAADTRRRPPSPARRRARAGRLPPAPASGSSDPVARSRPDAASPPKPAAPRPWLRAPPANGQAATR